MKFLVNILFIAEKQKPIFLKIYKAICKWCKDHGQRTVTGDLDDPRAGTMYVLSCDARGAMDMQLCAESFTFEHENYRHLKAVNFHPFNSIDEVQTILLFIDRSYMAVMSVTCTKPLDMYLIP